MNEKQLTQKLLKLINNPNFRIPAQPSGIELNLNLKQERFIRR